MLYHICVCGHSHEEFHGDVSKECYQKDCDCKLFVLDHVDELPPYAD